MPAAQFGQPANGKNGCSAHDAPDSLYVQRKALNALDADSRLATQQAAELWDELLLFSRNLDSLATSGATQTDAALLDLWASCDAAGTALVSYKQLKDKISARALALLQGSRLAPLQSLPAQPCPAESQPVDTDALLMALSELYTRLRLLQAGTLTLPTAASKDARQDAILPPFRPSGSRQAFVRQTTKFWLRPENVMRLQCKLIKHVPIFVYDLHQQAQQLHAGSMQERVSSLRQASSRACCTVSSVYFNNQQLSAYHARLQREDGATVVRVRWYGKRSQEGDQQLYVERKVHREPWSMQQSYKERASLMQRNILACMHGQGSLAGVTVDANEAAFLADVQTLLSTQEAKMRTIYCRTAFQEAASNAVRVSLDTDLAMTREAGVREGSDWCRPDGVPLGDGDVCCFPYPIVELKLQQPGPMPAWIDAMVAEGTLLEVKNFSKHLHGIAMLFPALVKRLPHWFRPDATGCMVPMRWHTIAASNGHANEAQATPAPVRTREQTAATCGASRSSPANGHTEALAAGRASCIGTDGSNHRGPAPSAMPQQVQCDGQDAVSPGMHGASRDTCPGMRDGQGGKEAGQGQSSAAALLPQLADALQVLGPKAQLHGPGVYATDLESGALIANGKPPAEPPRRSRLLGILRPFHHRTFQLRAWRGGKRAAPCSRQENLLGRAEPKTFFANERTFLAWMHIAVLVMLMGLSLLAGSAVSASKSHGSYSSGCSDSVACRASLISGILVTPVALALMVYALWQYKRRTQQIMHRNTPRYDDQRGPIILVVALIIVCGVAFGLTVAFSPALAQEVQKAKEQ